MIQVEKLTKDYGSALLAIDQVSFSVKKGEVVGFLGPNGAGKSTTMRILVGSLGATSGTARIGGLDVFEHPMQVKAMVGYLPERPPLYVDMTVRGYLLFCARIKGVSNTKRAVERAIERVNLESVAHRLIDHLSKGFRQRVGIAQAIVHEPQVLVLDEPASGLDPAQRVEIRKLIRELAADDTTIILSTHVLPEVEAVCDRVVIIDQGVIRTIGDVAEVVDGTGVALKVARPTQELLDALQALDGVQSVSNQGGGSLELACSHDVREAIAGIAVGAGLLELGAAGNLEDVFLRLTKGVSE